MMRMERHKHTLQPTPFIHAETLCTMSATLPHCGHIRQLCEKSHCVSSQAPQHQHETFRTVQPQHKHRETYITLLLHKHNLGVSPESF